MAYIYPCQGCWFGDHSKHNPTVIPSPVEGEEGLGGAVCDCQGECEASEKSPVDKVLEAIFKYRQEPL